MIPIIPISPQFDQPALGKLIEAEPVVQRYYTLFALFDWTALEPATKSTGPGRPAHPPSVYVSEVFADACEQGFYCLLSSLPVHYRLLYLLRLIDLVTINLNAGNNQVILLNTL